MMPSKTKKKGNGNIDVALKHFNQGCSMLYDFHMFGALAHGASIYRMEKTPFPANGWAAVCRNGDIFCHPKRRAEPEEWGWVLAHCLLHLGMGHFRETADARLWNLVCDCAAAKFLADMKLGAPPEPFLDAPPAFGTEEKLFERLYGKEPPKEYLGFGTAGPGQTDMIFNQDGDQNQGRGTDWQAAFAMGLGEAVRVAVNTAAGVGEDGNRILGSGRYENRISRAKEWFISSYPLLGAVAASFKIIDDPKLLGRMDISIAAVSPSLCEIYINPHAALHEEELRFVMAHEFLHAALRHDVRCEWRNAYLWNVACDFVINMWLAEMGVGERPEGALYDVQFKNMSAEAVYDKIAGDMRAYLDMDTFGGFGAGDIVPGDPGWQKRDGAVGLDDFYRRALGQGLAYHQERGRGYLPAGLVEEIRALAHPPIPWDVELARWFDGQFAPVEKKRSYARASRRQSATPDIPRPNWVVPQGAMDGRTFGVVLDTSGSMERGLLAAALGAIASYSGARDVPAARVVFCDADAYDQGYMPPEDIAGTVRVRGRGGTVLQPGIDLLLRAKDFPETAPILIITDAMCEARLIFHGREHAFLIPAGAHLPFVPKGKVFRMR
ncbi:MAG: hypothetical protein LBT26_04810 [Clostridiales Family XIII bacterium]|jgi:predicted metal-dependent peptidase|nr:hypothetical protein [Clostridiales Family XIII bacterium]